MSPSASVAAAAQVRVLLAVGALGETLTLERVGAVLETTTVFESTAAPVSVPSLGVTVHTTASSRENSVLEREEPVWLLALPPTVQA